MSTPKKAFYILLGLLGILVIAGAGIYYLLEQRLATLNQEIGKLLAEQEAIGQQIGVYQEAEKKVEELSFVEELADEVLPASKEQGNVLAEIQKFITDAGLGFDSVTFSPGSEKLGVDNSQTELRLGLTGVRALPVIAVVKPGASYEQVLSLLETIENNQRKMQVTKLSLTPQDLETQTSFSFSTITLEIDVYVRAATPPPAAPATQGATSPSSDTDEGNSSESQEGS